MSTPIYLITKADFAPYIDLATNLTDAKLQPRILEAQNFDLRPLMGDAMWFDFLPKTQADTIPPEIDKLLNGSDYVVKDITYSFDGIKPILVYFAGARLVKMLDMHITPNAVMNKRNDFSDPVDPKTIGRSITDFQNTAFGYWEDTAKYINAKGKTVYPLYPNFLLCGNEVNNFRPKTYGIKGRDTQEEYYNPNYNRYYGR